VKGRLLVALFVAADLASAGEIDLGIAELRRSLRAQVGYCGTLRREVRSKALGEAFPDVQRGRFCASSKGELWIELSAKEGTKTVFARKGRDPAWIRVGHEAPVEFPREREPDLLRLFGWLLGKGEDLGSFSVESLPGAPGLRFSLLSSDQLAELDWYRGAEGSSFPARISATDLLGTRNDFYFEDVKASSEAELEKVFVALRRPRR